MRFMVVVVFSFKFYPGRLEISRVKMDHLRKRLAVKCVDVSIFNTIFRIARYSSDFACVDLLKHNRILVKNQNSVVEVHKDEVVHHMHIKG